MGDGLWVVDGSGGSSSSSVGPNASSLSPTPTLRCSPVVSIAHFLEAGFSHPITASLSIVVNGVAASPFAVNHAIPEAWYSIHRMLYAVLPAALGFKLFQQTSERFGDLSVQFSL